MPAQRINRLFARSRLVDMTFSSSPSAGVHRRDLCGEKCKGRWLASQPASRLNMMPGLLLPAGFLYHLALFVPSPVAPNALSNLQPPSSIT